VKLIDPVSYHETLRLVANSKIVLTDSGGLQKEAFWLHIPCITLRENTEWIETVDLGANTLTGADMEKILEEARKYLLFKGYKAELKDLPNPFGDGRASKRIIKILNDSLVS